MGPLWEALKAVQRPKGGTYCWFETQEVLIPFFPPMTIDVEQRPTPYWGIVTYQLRWDPSVVPGVFTKLGMTEGSRTFNITITPAQTQAPWDTFILITEANPVRWSLINPGPLNHYYYACYSMLIFPTKNDWEGAWNTVLQQEVLQRETLAVLKGLKGVPSVPLPPLTG